ncbi:MAG: biotin/lipoyl-containing protein [Dehalococcoidia bacterium]
MPAVIMPKLGDSMEEGTLVRWLKTVGDVVVADEPLAEIETDKATVELPAETGGTIAQLLVTEGAAVSVGAAIAVILEPGELVDAPPPAGNTNDVHRQASPADLGQNPTARTPVHVARPDTRGVVRASPAARQLARDRGVDLQQIRGSGPNGRIVRADIETFIQHADMPDRSTADGVVGAGHLSPSSPASAPRPPSPARPLQVASTVPPGTTAPRPAGW